MDRVTDSRTYKIKSSILTIVLIQKFMIIIERALLKRAFLVSVSRSLFHFFYNRAHIKTRPSVKTTEGLCYRKNQLKSLWKGVWG